MQVSNFAIISAIEIYVVLVLLTAFLLINTRKLKGLINRLQKKLKKTLKELNALKEAQALLDAQPEITVPESSYQQLINDQLLLTREYHQTLDSGQDISLDLSPKAPIDRQVAAFRHAVLIAEKEAILSGEGDEPNWKSLETRISQLMDFYKLEEPSSSLDMQEIDAEISPEKIEELKTELATAKREKEGLERYKDLFSNMEDMWKQAKAEAQDYHEQLSAMGDSVQDKDSFDDLLKRYNQVYDQVGDAIDIDSSSSGSTQVVEKEGSHTTSTVEIVRTDEKTSKQLRQLQSLAGEQHRIIEELKNKISSAGSDNEKVSLIHDLSEQLDQQARFTKESESCIQLLEGELDNAMNRIDELQAQQTKAEAAPAAGSASEQIQELSNENIAMKKKIEQLEMETEQLFTQLETALGRPEE